MNPEMLSRVIAFVAVLAFGAVAVFCILTYIREDEDSDRFDF